MSSDLTPAQIFEFYHRRLIEVLVSYNPAGCKTISTLLKQFPGKEHDVYIQICNKCGVIPVDRPTLDDFENSVGKPFSQKPRRGSVAKWLTTHDFHKYANKHQFQAISLGDFFAISSKRKLIELGVSPKDTTTLLDAISRERGEDGISKKQLAHRKPADFEVGENCYTKMVMPSNKGGVKWLNARVIDVNDDNSFNIFVYNSKEFNVPQEAVSVPRHMLKKLSEDIDVVVPEKKRKSVKRRQFKSGDRIRLCGLRSYTAYNGMCGTVLLSVPTERRYQVRLDTNVVIAIKQSKVGPVDPEKDDERSVKVGVTTKEEGIVVKTDEVMLSELMAKLMQDNPDTDPGKLGEFAAGYLYAKRKMNTLGEM